MKNTVDVYNQYAEFKGWDSLFTYSKAQALQFKNIFEGINLNQANILEIGFGSGAMMMWLKDQGASVCGIELQPDLIAAAEKNGFKTFQSLQEVPARSFHLIIAMDVFEHINRDSINDYLNDIYTILVEEGNLVARFPNCQSPSGVFTQYGDHTHVSHLSVPIFKFHASCAGLDLVKSFEGFAVEIYSEGLLKHYVKKVLRLVFRRAVALALGAGPTPLWADVVVVCKRKSD